MTRTEENDSVMSTIINMLPDEASKEEADSIHLGMIMCVLADISKSLAMITDQMTGNVSKESEKTIEESENSEDLTYFLDCLESRVWELGVDTGNANPLDPDVAYKKGKIDAYNSVLCALGRKDGTEEADE